MRHKNRINIYLQYLLVFFVILDSRSVFAHIYDSNLGKFLSVFIILDLLAIFIINFNKKLKKNTILFLLAYFIYISIFFLLGVQDSRLSFLSSFFVIFPLMFLMFSVFDKEQIQNLLKAYINVMFVIAFVSLVFYIGGSLLKLVEPNVSLNIDWGGLQSIYGYHYLHFDSQTTVIFDQVLLRNSSIFVEGPMFALHLILAMGFALFYKKNMFNKYTIVFGLSIISSLSLTGMLISLFLILYRFLFYNKNKNIRFLKIMVIFFVLIIGLFLFYDKAETRSYNIRGDDFRAGYLAWKEHKIMGNGFMNNELAVSFMSDFRSYNTGLSSSLVIVLVQGGIYLALFYLFPFVIGFLKYLLHGKNLYLLELFLVQFSLIFMNAYQYTSIMMVLLAFDYYFLLYSNKNEELKNFFLGDESHETI